MNSPFETIEQIQEVSGIGPAKFDGIKELITAGESP
jgi:DNA uptake protein ComE-like DNA-binding protein